MGASVHTSIDPRIRARRIAVQRDEGRRRLRRLAVAFGAVAVVAAGWGATRTPFLDVDHVQVTGATHTAVADVVGASRVHRGQAMTTLPLRRMARRVAALPWVQTVDVHRRWPGTVVLRIVERRPVAIVPAAKGFVLLDGEGHELAHVDAPPAGVLRVDVPAVHPNPGAELTSVRPVLDLAATIPPVLRRAVVALRPEQDGAVTATVTLRNGSTATVLFGAPTQTAAKWLTLATVLDEADPVRLATIDLRVPGAPALTRR